MEKGNDATHFDLPSGIAVLKNGNIVVTDGYGNNRVVMFDKTASSSSRSRKAPAVRGQGHGPRRMGVAAQARRRCAGEHLHHRSRRPSPPGVRQEPELPARDQGRGLESWDIGISRKGDDGFAFIADHAGERMHKCR